MSKPELRDDERNSPNRGGGLGVSAGADTDALIAEGAVEVAGIDHAFWPSRGDIDQYRDSFGGRDDTITDDQIAFHLARLNYTNCVDTETEEMLQIVENETGISRLSSELLHSISFLIYDPIYEGCPRDLVIRYFDNGTATKCGGDTLDRSIGISLKHTYNPNFFHYSGYEYASEKAKSDKEVAISFSNGLKSLYERFGVKGGIEIDTDLDLGEEIEGLGAFDRDSLDDRTYHEVRNVPSEFWPTYAEIRAYHREKESQWGDRYEEVRNTGGILMHDDDIAKELAMDKRAGEKVVDDGLEVNLTGYKKSEYKGRKIESGGQDYFIEDYYNNNIFGLGSFCVVSDSNGFCYMFRNPKGPILTPGELSTRDSSEDSDLGVLNYSMDEDFLSRYELNNKKSRLSNTCVIHRGSKKYLLDGKGRIVSEFSDRNNIYEIGNRYILVSVGKGTYKLYDFVGSCPRAIEPDFYIANGRLDISEDGLIVDYTSQDLNDARFKGIYARNLVNWVDLGKIALDKFSEDNKVNFGDGKRKGYYKVKPGDGPKLSYESGKIHVKVIKRGWTRRIDLETSYNTQELLNL